MRRAVRQHLLNPLAVALLGEGEGARSIRVDLDEERDALDIAIGESRGAGEEAATADEPRQ